MSGDENGDQRSPEDPEPSKPELKSGVLVGEGSDEKSGSVAVIPWPAKVGDGSSY